MEKKYTADDIRILRGLEPIRKRPEMYFTQKGREILLYLLTGVVESLVKPECLCNASNIELKIPNKGGVIVKYDGNGMPIASEAVDGISHPVIYRAIMSTAFLRGKGQNYEYYGHLNSVGALVDAFSEELTIVTVGDNCAYSTTFKYGAIESLFTKISTSMYTKNEIYIVFGDQYLEGKPLCRDDLELLSKDLRLSFPACKIAIS